MNRIPSGRLHLWVVGAARLIGGLMLLGGPVAAAQPGAPPPRVWSQEVAEALAIYRAGDYGTAQRLCQQLLVRPGEGPWRRDAAVIDALCLLRMPARADRLEGRARLAQLSCEDPTLGDEPDCALAYGIAQTALSETSAALEALERAAAGFAAHGPSERRAAPLVALAEAWARHSEWETTPPRFGVQRPQNKAEANALRRGQIEAVRARLEALPNHEEAVTRVDLVLAGYLINAGEAPDQGYEILVRLAAGLPLTPAAGQAAMQLGAHYEALERWNDALSLYGRVQREGPSDLACEAEQRAIDITRPQIVLEVPAMVRSGATVTARLRVHGLERIQFEVRQVDAEAWLADARTRISEAQLPESGSVRAARDLDTRAATAYAWWVSDTLDPPLDFSVAPGAYVVLARGAGSDGRSVTVKQLVVVSDLTATCFVGPRRAVLWAVRPADTTSDRASGTATARFWMNRSFAPTEISFDGNVARFALPGEARVMRDKGWVCLVRWGEHIAVCRGEVPRPAPAETAPRVVLVAGPPEPEVGESLYVSGLVLPRGGGRLELSSEAALELQVVDTLERVAFTAQVELAAGGAFATQVPIAPKLEGRHLRVLARYQGRLLENAGGRTTVRVPPREAARFRVRLDVPTWLSGPNPQVSGSVRVAYPWGTVPTWTPVQCTLRAVQLPVTGIDDEPASGAGVERGGLLDDAGQMALEVPLEEFGLRSGPVAIRMLATVTSPEGREGGASAEVLVGPEQPHVWLTNRPADPVTGQHVRFHVGWFAPGGLAVARVPEIEVRRDGAEVARLRLHDDEEGFSSELWRPTQPGSYEIAATVPLVDSEALRVRKTVAVAAAEVASQPAQARLLCTAHFTRQDDRPAVRVLLEGESRSPLLVLVAGRDAQAAQSLAGASGRAELLLPLDDEPAAGLHVMAVSAGRDGCEILRIEEVNPDPQQRLTLTLNLAQTDVWPGTKVAVEALCRRPAAALIATTLTARLTSAAKAGFSDPTSGASREAAAATVPDLVIVSSAGGSVRPAAPAGPQARPDGATLWSALSEGATLWSTSVAAEEEMTRLTVPMPAVPGLYRLIVLAHSPDGTVASDAAILDARRGVRLAADIPPRLTLGDQSLLALHVENGYPEPVEARIRWEASAGLRVGAVRIENQGRRGARLPAHEPVTVNLPAEGSAWLFMEVVAAAAGPQSLVAQVAARGVEGTTRGSCEVLPADSRPVSGAVAKIKRTVFVWREPTPAPQPAGDEHDDQEQPTRRRNWVAMSPGDQLVPGQFIKLHEELTLQEPQPEMVWSQRVPATCAMLKREPRGMQTLGWREEERTAALVYNVPRLTPGTHVHEYFLAVVRPGACLFPAPELRRGDTVLPAAVEPVELRLSVPEEK